MKGSPIEVLQGAPKQRVSDAGALKLALPVAAMIVLVGAMGPNLSYALLCAGVLVLGSLLLWRPGEVPILLLMFGWPWAQASVAILHASWLGIDLEVYSPIPGDIHQAATLSLVSVATLALGMRIGAGQPSGSSLSGQSIALAHPLSRWCLLYVVGSGASYVALMSVWVVPGLSQVMLALGGLKWAFFFMLAYAAVVQGTIWSALFVIPFLVELLSGIGGFFSDFKTVFLVTMLAAAAARVRMSPQATIGFGALAGVLLVFFVIWTAVKFDYRAIVAADSGQQSVDLDYSTRMTKLVELVENLDEDGVRAGLDNFLHRLSYVEYFGAVVAYVPSAAPHEGGALLWDAVTRPFMPRLFFPDKAPIDDTERTNLYTGGVAGDSEGTSISLGYVAESYIDFGETGMFVALLAIGLFYGRVYRYFHTSGHFAGMLGMGLATAVLLDIGALENSFTKVFGAVIVSLLASWMLGAYILPRFFPWVLAPEATTITGATGKERLVAPRMGRS